MSTSSDWRRSLCCPACCGGLSSTESALRCRQCETMYEVTPAGVPLLLTAEDRRRFAAVLDEAAGQRMAALYSRRSRTDWITRLGRALTPPLPVYHDPCEPVLPAAANGVNLWLGGGGRRIPGFINIDLAPFYGVDLAANASRIPFLEATCDAVSCSALLEHVEDPATVVAEMWRVLKPGGHAHAVVPFCHPWHGFPSDYQRYTREGLARLFGAFECVSLGLRTGPTTTLLTFLTYYGKLIFPVHTGNPVRRWFNRGVMVAWGWLTAPLRYLDIWMNRLPEAHVLANHIYILARKPVAK